MDCSQLINRELEECSTADREEDSLEQLTFIIIAAAIIVLLLIIYLILQIRKFMREKTSAALQENRKGDQDQRELHNEYQKYLNFKKIEQLVI